MIDVNSIIAGVQEYAKPNRYKVELFPPVKMTNGGTKGILDIGSIISDAKDYVTGEQGFGDQRSIGLNCSSVVMPGISYATKEVRTGNGPLTKIPYDKIFEPVIATFYTDVEYNGRRFFLDWMNTINSTDDWMGDNSNHYDFYNDYIGAMYIYQLDAINLPSHLVELVEMYPTVVSELALGYENGNAISTYTVTFTYRYWKMKKINRAAARALDTARGFTDLF